MAPFFAGLEGRRPDEGFQLLTEIFHLEDQLGGPAAASPGDR
jgi:L-rhamnose mutarotase